jgi:Holliday junction resolvase RusA-like endonuclease
MRGWYARWPKELERVKIPEDKAAVALRRLGPGPGPGPGNMAYRNTEKDLKQYEANMKKIKAGGGGTAMPADTAPKCRSVINPAPPPLIQSFFVPGLLPGANDIIRKHHMVYSKLKSQWGLTIARCIIVAKLKRVQTCTIAFLWQELHDRRDDDNIMFGQKFVLDALRDTRIIPDDRRRFVRSNTHRIIVEPDNPGVLVTIEESR